MFASKSMSKGDDMKKRAFSFATKSALAIAISAVSLSSSAVLTTPQTNKTAETIERAVGQLPHLKLLMEPSNANQTLMAWHSSHSSHGSHGSHHSHISHGSHSSHSSGYYN